MKTTKQTIKEKFREECEIEIGYITALFMSQGDKKAKDIIMPTEKLEESMDRIELYFSKALSEQREDIKKTIHFSLKDAEEVTNVVKYKIIKEIKKLPTKFPEMESDTYDIASEDMLNSVIKKIKEL